MIMDIQSKQLVWVRCGVCAALTEVNHAPHGTGVTEVNTVRMPGNIGGWTLPPGIINKPYWVDKSQTASGQAQLHEILPAVRVDF